MRAARRSAPKASPATSRSLRKPPRAPWSPRGCDRACTGAAPGEAGILAEIRRARAGRPTLKSAVAAASSSRCRQARRAGSRAAQPDTAPCPYDRSTSALSAASPECRLPRWLKARGHNIRARGRRTRIPPCHSIATENPRRFRRPAPRLVRADPLRWAPETVLARPST